MSNIIPHGLHFKQCAFVGYGETLSLYGSVLVPCKEPRKHFKFLQKDRVTDYHHENQSVSRTVTFQDFQGLETDTYKFQGFKRFQGSVQTL